ncbi:PocR ligand-binding domain-containing protein [Aminiphilus sp.]|uniref:sensor histidine kinase n=1 Tax=Aminiphilus sp. TaxID=1872488 RepID=UPI0026141843|nr:PocR ligand-binding domain-containing protein [Aminiphilus sp.]
MKKNVLSETNRHFWPNALEAPEAESPASEECLQCTRHIEGCVSPEEDTLPEEFDPLRKASAFSPGKEEMSMQHGSLAWWEQVAEIARLQEIQDRFAKIMRVGAIITTNDGKPVTSPSNFSSFCLKVRTFSEGRARCWESDADGGRRSLEAGHSFAYRCRNGLLDMASPIIVEGRMVGILLCGQVLLKKYSRTEVEEIADKEWPFARGRDQEALIENFLSVSVVNEQAIRDAMDLLHLVASHIVGLCERHLTERRLLQRGITLIHEQRNKEALERNLKLAQVRALRSQLNPHFMFNTLNSIARLAFFEEAPRTQDLTLQFAEYLRYVLRKQSQGELVPLGMELDCIRRYLEIYQVRFGERLRSHVEALHGSEELLVPFMFLQPIVENAIIHGIEPLPQGGEVRISCWVDKKHLVVEVTDNGVGCTPSSIEEGVGLENVQERLKLHYGEIARLRVESAPGKGTSVRIALPAREGVLVS